MSYTTFKDDNLSITPQNLKAGDSVQVSFQITNTGKRDGDEVAQLYIHDAVSSVTTYEKRLCGFERVHLKAGETKTVTMKILPECLSLSNLNYDRVIEPGDFEVMVGASSVDIRLEGRFTMTEEQLIWKMPELIKN